MIQVKTLETLKAERILKIDNRFNGVEALKRYSDSVKDLKSEYSNKSLKSRISASKFRLL